MSRIPTPRDTANLDSAMAPSVSDLLSAVEALLGDERDWLANLANVAALLPAHLQDINWAGFYLWRQGELSCSVRSRATRPACVSRRVAVFAAKR